MMESSWMINMLWFGKLLEAVFIVLPASQESYNPIYRDYIEYYYFVDNIYS